jgi:hypothetical protein
MQRQWHRNDRLQKWMWPLRPHSNGKGGCCWLQMTNNTSRTATSYNSNGERCNWHWRFMQNSNSKRLSECWGWYLSVVCQADYHAQFMYENVECTLWLLGDHIRTSDWLSGLEMLAFIEVSKLQRANQWK